jgi:hypothetical protein
MARNNEFEFAKSNITGPVHFTFKQNRKNIEKNGLLRSDPVAIGHAEPFEGHDLSGVYFYYPPGVAEQENGIHGANMDVWELTHKHQYELNDDPTMTGEAIYTPDDVEPRHLRRVGHTTANYELHWHREEDCPNK